MSDYLDLSGLQKAILSLTESLEIVNDSVWFQQQSTKVQQTLMAGVIKNFEFVYEISIKMIKRRLEIGAANPSEIDSMEFRQLLRTAAECGLCADVEAWFRYRKMRNITAHTYDHDKALAVYQETLSFIGDAHYLLTALKKRNDAP